jgi:hypothetical protein
MAPVPRAPRRERPYRGVALGVVGFGLVALCFVSYILLRPVYWKLYAEVIHRYEPDPVSSAAQLAGGAGERVLCCFVGRWRRADVFVQGSA